MNRLIIIASFALFCAFDLNAQLTFNVSPGVISGGTSLGYKMNDLVPYFGLQYFGASYTYERSGVDYNSSGIKTPYSNKDEMSANVYLPQIGAKYFIKNMKGIKLYLNGSINYALLSASTISNGIENQSVKEAASGMSIWGLEFGVGTEYFFSNNFSIGGEFDLRLLFAGSTNSDNTTIYNPKTGNSESSTVNYKYNVNMGITNSKLILNYYFGE